MSFQPRISFVRKLYLESDGAKEKNGTLFFWKSLSCYSAIWAEKLRGVDDLKWYMNGQVREAVGNMGEVVRIGILFDRPGVF